MEYIWVILTISWLMSVHCKNIKNKGFPRYDLKELSLVTYDGPSGGSGTGPGLGDRVIDTNLDSHVADHYLWDVQRIYNKSKTTNKRAVKCREYIAFTWPHFYVSVIINSSTAQFYQRFYLIVSVQGDRVLAFGW